MRRAGYCLLGAMQFLTFASVAHSQQLEEVVVTAQKREERLQNVPVAVTAVTGKQLEQAGVSGTRDLTLIAPGLNFAQGGFIAQPQIRGVGTRGVGAGDEATVPIYIDGIYQNMQQAGFFEFNSVERIEVLKGPQATLFGRNAMGGAISIITADPAQTPEAKGDVSLARFGEKKFNLYGNTPLTDRLAANISVHGDEDNGYIQDLVRGGKIGRTSSIGARSKFLWNAADNVDVLFGATYLKSSDNTAQTAHPIDGNTYVLQKTSAVTLAGPYQAALNFVPYFHLEQATGFGIVSAHLDAFDANFSLSYSDTNLDNHTDIDTTPIDAAILYYSQGSKAWTSELRFTSNKEGPLQWIGGVYAYIDDASYGRGPSLFLSRGSATGATTALIVDSDTRAYSTFAEGTYEVLPGLSLTGGLRYSFEHREIWQQLSSTPFGAPAIIPPAPYSHNTAHFNKLSPRAVIRYQVKPDVQVYGSYTQGFKSGLFNASTVAGPTPPALQPEILKAFEVGLKTKLTPAVRFNVSAYHYDYQNMQISSRNLTGGTTVQNAASSKISGGEAEFAWAATNNWNVDAGLAYAHARFQDFPGAVTYPRRPDGFGNTLVFADVSGKALPKTPDWTLNLGSDYTIPLHNSRIIVSGSAFWSAKSFQDAGNLYRVAPYNVMNAQVTWVAPGDRFSASLFGENLTNDDRPLTIQASPAGAYTSNVKPRSVGLKLSYNWN